MRKQSSASDLLAYLRLARSDPKSGWATRALLDAYDADGICQQRQGCHSYKAINCMLDASLLAGMQPADKLCEVFSCQRVRTEAPRALLAKYARERARLSALHPWSVFKALDEIGWRPHATFLLRPVRDTCLQCMHATNIACLCIIHMRWHVCVHTGGKVPGQ